MGDSSDYQHLLGKAQDAAIGGARAWGAQSTGERLAVALVLNRPEWLAEMGYTIAEALNRIGPEWVPLIPRVARDVSEATDAVAHQVAQIATEEATTAILAADEARFDAALVTYGSAPGYRDAELVFELRAGPRTSRAALRLRPEDAEPIIRHLRDVHRVAWKRGEPLDMRAGEQRPRWID